MSAAEEAAALSKAHKKWMIDCLRESEGNACSYEKIVETSTLATYDIQRQATACHRPAVYPDISAVPVRHEKVGEEKQCDTVGAMLKLLKRDGVVDFNGQFLMYPMHKDEIITLKDAATVDTYYAGLG